MNLAPLHAKIGQLALENDFLGSIRVSQRYLGAFRSFSLVT